MIQGLELFSLNHRPQADRDWTSGKHRLKFN